MIINNKIVSVTFKIIIIILCGSGLYLKSGLAHAEKKSKNISGMLIYFTYLSNMLCLLYFVVSSILILINIVNYGIAGSVTALLPELKGSIVLCLLITLLVYNFVLIPHRKKSKMNDTNGLYDFPDICVHCAVPILAFFDWILFDDKRIYTLFSPLFWLIIVLLYTIFIMLRGMLTGKHKAADNKYPYFFLDVDRLGTKRVSLYLLLFGVLYIILGYLVLFIGYFVNVLLY